MATALAFYGSYVDKKWTIISGRGTTTIKLCPALLFSRFDKSLNRDRQFYACSAFRDRKDCSFFLWKDDRVTDSKNVERQEIIKSQQPKFTHIQFRKRFLLFKKLRKKDRQFCQSCGLCLLPDEINEHIHHKIISPVTREMLQKPTQLFIPRDDNKTYAQYFFSSSTVQFLLSTLKILGYSSIVCIGSPTIHEAIQEKKKDEDFTLKSLLLDLDCRYMQTYSKKTFCRYNMFNNHFFNYKDEDVLKNFVTEVNSGSSVAVVIDPPFGGMVDVLADTLKKLSEIYRTASQGINDHHLPVLWFFPYFMEKRIVDALPSFSMLDYKVKLCVDANSKRKGKVDYDNHIFFKARDRGRKHGSPVRIFTNIEPRLFVLPSDEGYWFCDICQRYCARENQHCDKCNKCTSKDGKTYVHCDRCNRCVKPSRQHCDTCDSCELNDHKCGARKKIGCYICGDESHKRRDCPNKATVFKEKGVKRKANKIIKSAKKQK